MNDYSDAMKIGILMIGLIAACAFLGWDPTEQSESEIITKSEGSQVAISLNVTSINWGILEPGQFSERAMLIENIGKDPCSLSINASNFSPEEAEKFMNISWNIDPKFILEPQKNVAAILRLNVSSLIEGIKEFSFDVVITISEVE